MRIKLKHKGDIERNVLLELNTFIHKNNKHFEYHINHIKLVERYAILLNKRLNAHLDNHKLMYISLAHDLFKERSLDPELVEIKYKGYTIPQDTIRYVRSNIDMLEKFDLGDYFNTDVQYHALSAGIFVFSELGICDPEILYPIMFHSCPIISIYEQLSPKIQNMIDVIMLADKLSSNYLRINLKESPVRIDLDKVVFGTTGIELNYTLGLYLARLISQGKSTEEQSTIATEYYYKRLNDMNPIISKNYTIKKLGDPQIWEKRKSQAFKIQY